MAAKYKQSVWPQSTRICENIYAVRYRMMHHSEVRTIAELKKAMQFAIEDATLHYSVSDSGDAILRTRIIVPLVLDKIHITYVLLDKNAVETRVHTLAKLCAIGDVRVCELPPHGFLFDPPGPCDILINTVEQGMALNRRFEPILAKVLAIAHRKEGMLAKRRQLKAWNINNALWNLRKIGCDWYFVGHVTKSGTISWVEDPEHVLPKQAACKWFVYDNLNGPPLSRDKKRIRLPITQKIPRMVIIGVDGLTDEMESVNLVMPPAHIHVILRYE